VIGSTAGGAAVGAVLGGVGVLLHVVGVPMRARGAVVIPVALVAAYVDARGWPRWLPRPRRQVDERWLNAYRGWVYGAGFGFQLGMGVVTIVTAATVYLLGAAIVAIGSPLAGALIGGAYGLARGLTILAGRSIRSPGRLVEFHRTLIARRRMGVVAAVVGDLAVAAGALVLLGGWATP
jgi:hypothetical protein